MDGDGKERRIELCGQAAIEQATKLLALTNEIIRLLEEKRAHPQANPSPTRVND
jgi:hypothetical protein